MKTQIALHGSYWKRNFGDTLILSIIADWIYDFNPNIEINLPFCKNDLEAKEITRGRSYVFDPSLKNTSLFIFGPGGYFGEPSGTILEKQKWNTSHYEKHLSWNLKLFSNDIPTMVVGVGVGPLSEQMNKDGVIRLFNYSNEVIVRDSVSYKYANDWLRDINLLQTCDVALSLINQADKIKGKRKSLGIHFPGIINNPIILIILLFNVWRWSKRFAVYLLEDAENQHKTKDPRSLLFWIRVLKISIGVKAYLNPSKTIKNIGGLDYIFTSKLHVAIVAYTQETKVLSVPFHSKTKRFFSQIGREKYCVERNWKSLKHLPIIMRQLERDTKPTNTLIKLATSNKFYLHAFLQKNIQLREIGE